MGKSRRDAHFRRAFGCRRASEKKDKQFWHRAYRRAVRVALKSGREDDPHFREFSDPWVMSKDGPGVYVRYPPPELFRK
jgi:hypothetical protein